MARFDARLSARNAPTLRNWGAAPSGMDADKLPRDFSIDCGWGRLIFAHTFTSNEAIAETLRAEAPGRRDIALYLRDPHVVLALAPHELFLDPSHTYRLWLERYRPRRTAHRGFAIRRLRTIEDAEAVNRIYAARRMVTVEPSFLCEGRNSRFHSCFVAVDTVSNEVMATVTGVDHVGAFDDPENGASLWCLAVDPQASQPGMGEALVRHVAEFYQARGRAYLDLSVMHDNANAIALYEKIGFQRVPVFCLKTKNSFNECLFTGPSLDANLNPYARIIVDEARRRGIGVKVIDEDGSYFQLSYGGRSLVCRESLSELTSAIAMSRCQDKTVTLRLLREAGLRVPAQHSVTGKKRDHAFLRRHKRIVVKPADGEQGHGVFVDIREPSDMEAAIAKAGQFGNHVVLEEYVEGEDLRIVMIDGAVVAAAIRRPARIVGNGRHTVAELIAKQSRRRAAATGGESRIPLDGETERCVRVAGYDMESVLPADTELAVRRTANLHTGGTIHDVTAVLHPDLAAAACEAARVLEIPVTGLDFIVAAPDRPDYVVIEANERPGLANHEPQPTAERFVDFLFPQSMVRPASVAPAAP